MKIGIDGNCWYCSNGLCLGDPRAKFTFARTLREAVDDFTEKYQFDERGRLQNDVTVPLELRDALDMTPEDYRHEET